MGTEDLHIETTEGVSDNVVLARYVLCSNVEVMLKNRLRRRTMMCGQWEVHNGLVVTVELYAEGRSPVSPGTGGLYNGVLLFPLYSVLLL